MSITLAALYAATFSATEYFKYYLALASSKARKRQFYPAILYCTELTTRIDRHWRVKLFIASLLRVEIKASIASSAQVDFRAFITLYCQAAWYFHVYILLSWFTLGADDWVIICSMLPSSSVRGFMPSAPTRYYCTGIGYVRRASARAQDYLSALSFSARWWLKAWK